MDKLLKQRPVITLTVITFALVLLLLGVTRILKFEPNTVLLLSQIIVLIPTIYLLKIRGLLHIFKFDFNSFSRGLLLGWFGILLSLFYFVSKFELFASTKFTIASFLIIVIGNLLVGAFEEILLRGFVFNELLEHYSPIRSAVISGIIFGLAHVFNFLVSEPAAVVSQLVYAFFLGVFFAAIYYVTKDIWSVILIHGLIDTVSVLTKGVPTSTPSAPVDVITSIVSATVVSITVLPALIIGIIIFKRHAKKQKSVA